MGGNLFKDLRRLSKSEFPQYSVKVIGMLKESLFTEESQIRVTRSYFSKESFGDMDVIVESDYLKSDWIECLMAKFNLDDSEFSKNGNVASFKYENFQVDLILTPSETYHCAYDYFSWNDLCNLMGRITYKHGLKFGHNGTYVVVKDGSHQLGEVLVTTHVFELCEYFGWDFEKFHSGFETMEEAYEWVTKSPYFNKNVFSLENRNHTAAIRDRKRPNYTKFLEWLETKNDLPEYPYQEENSKGGYYIREPYFSMLCQKWPQVKTKVNLMLKDYNTQLKFKDNFNGNLVSDVTGLDGIHLGKFMRWAMENFKENQHLFKFVVNSLNVDSDRKLFVEKIHRLYLENKSFSDDNTLGLTEVSGCDECENKATYRDKFLFLCDECK